MATTTSHLTVFPAATPHLHLEPIDDPDRDPEPCPALFEPTEDRRPRRARDTAATPPDAPHCAEPSLRHLDTAAVSFFYDADDSLEPDDLAVPCLRNPAL